MRHVQIIRLDLLHFPLILTNTLLTKIAARLKRIIDKKTKITNTPIQKQIIKVVLYPKIRPNIRAMIRRKHSINKTVKMTNLKYSHVGFVFFSNLFDLRTDVGIQWTMRSVAKDNFTTMTCDAADGCGPAAKAIFSFLPP
jgi:hypothetical protein